MKLIVNIKGKPITLTIEEARELYNELDMVFKNNDTVYIPTYPYWPTFRPSLTKEDWYVTTTVKKDGWNTGGTITKVHTKDST